jgi:hypothetical protein
MLIVRVHCEMNFHSAIMFEKEKQSADDDDITFLLSSFVVSLFSLCFFLSLLLNHCFSYVKTLTLWFGSGFGFSVQLTLKCRRPRDL